MNDVAAHGWDAAEAALPAWSLPKDAVDRIALPPSGPSSVTREWAWGGSTGEGRTSLHPRLWGRGGASARRRARERRRRSRSARTTRSSPTRTPRATSRGHGTACAGIVRALAPECSISSVRVLGSTLHGKRRGAPRRAPLRRRAGLRRHQHEPLDDEEAVRGRAARARGQRVLQAHGARRVGAQHAGRELPVAVLVGHLGRAATRRTTRSRSSTTRTRRSSSSAAGSTSRSPWLGGRSLTVSGNSFATPHLTAICALILAKHPELTPFQLKSVLYLTATNVGGGEMTEKPRASRRRRGRRRRLGGVVPRAARRDRARSHARSSARRHPRSSCSTRRRRSSSSRPSSERARSTLLGYALPRRQGDRRLGARDANAARHRGRQQDPRFATDVAEGTGYVPSGLMAAPLLHEERALGVLEVLDRPGAVALQPQGDGAPRAVREPGRDRGRPAAQGAARQRSCSDAGRRRPRGRRAARGSRRRARGRRREAGCGSFASSPRCSQRRRRSRGLM